MTTISMRHREKLETCLSDVTMSHPPVALWRHFPVDDQVSGNLAAATVDFQRRYDFDLVKVTPASSFCIRDWGARDEWRGVPEGTREYVNFVIKEPEDWYKLQPLDPNQGSLGKQLDCLVHIKSDLGESVPIIQTIFNPLAQAKNLAGRNKLLVHLRKYPDAVHAGLKTISESIIRFIDASLHVGIDGVFYAVQHAQFGLLSQGEYERFGRQYDLPILEHITPFWFNILHLHGDDIMFDMFTDYPVQVINWHDRETAPNLVQAQQKFMGAVCGGLRRWETMVLGNPEEIMVEAKDAIQMTKGKRFILGTGCVLPTVAPHGNIMTAKRSVE